LTEIASSFKITYHREKLGDYLNGKNIFPATLELDITSQCNRTCTDCPSSRSTQAHWLGMNFIENLFAGLEGQTQGLLLTGGEPTLSPDFPQVLKKARNLGFTEIAVVTNGGFLNEESVANALLAYASTIRISVYDWEKGACRERQTVLKRIENLRKRIENERSDLQIGVSVLTDRNRIALLPKIANAVCAAGAHWAYFHPMCTGWELGRPVSKNQLGVLTVLENYQKRLTDGFGVYFSRDRYLPAQLEFRKYHTANFLLVVGADGLNYLGAEVKYNPSYVIADLSKNWHGNFLWRASRQKRIQSVNNENYAALHSRHRGVLYNDLVEKFINGRMDLAEITSSSSSHDFYFPHIL